MSDVKWVKGPYPDYGEAGRIFKLLKRLERRYEQLPPGARIPKERILRKYAKLKKTLDLLQGKDE